VSVRIESIFSFHGIHSNFVFFLNLGSNSEAQAFLQRNGQVIIRMRGLPFDATAKDVVSMKFLYRFKILFFLILFTHQCEYFL
jgi:hypothetical protein